MERQTSRIPCNFSRDENGEYFLADFPSIGARIYADTIDGLEDAIHDGLAHLWKSYAKADDAKLTQAAQDLKRRVSIAFYEAGFVKDGEFFAKDAANSLFNDFKHSTAYLSQPHPGGVK